MKLRYLHPLEYPYPVRRLDERPEAISVLGDITPGACHVAIVGSRAANSATIAFVKRLAGVVVEAGGVVISGGADGADTAAHEGAMEAGGRTWAVLGCGAPHWGGPKERFERIVESGGAVIRPFPEEAKPCSGRYLSRNRVLVALAEIVIVAQAAMKSGTSNAATHARDLGRELWVVPGAGDEFALSWRLLDGGARMLRHQAELAARLRVPRLEGDERLIYDALERPKHPDEIAAETGLSTSAVATALLTLALGDVVVEGSAGLFQRK